MQSLTILAVMRMTETNKGDVENMSEEKKHWTEEVEEFAELQIGENHLDITAEPYVVGGKYGDRLRIPTTLGLWNISLSSPIAKELKKIYEKQGKLTSTSLTVARTGKEKDTRYSIVKVVLQPQRKHETPPPGQAMLNLENLTPEQQEAIKKIVNPTKEQPQQ